MSEAEKTGVRCRIEGRLGRITLNRPQAMNALNLPMIRAITRTLHTWQHDDRAQIVVLDGAGERGFCAGGDIVQVHESTTGDHGIARTLWREEYHLDALLARYPKPVVSLMDGIVMGGGIGLTGHRRIRVVTERSVLAMPEVAIGLAPDVGGTFLLSRAPGELGTHLALTAARIGPHDAIACGMADHLVRSETLPKLLEALQDGDPDDIVTATAEPEAAGSLTTSRHWIDACYSADHVELIRERLSRRPEPEAGEALAALDAASPTALKVTLRALRRAREMSRLEECLVQDYRVTCRFLDQPDLAEGIRAAVIDKDRSPRWSPAQLADVDEATVEHHFAPLDTADLVV